MIAVLIIACTIVSSAIVLIGAYELTTRVRDGINGRRAAAAKEAADLKAQVVELEKEMREGRAK